MIQPAGGACQEEPGAMGLLEFVAVVAVCGVKGGIYGVGTGQAVVDGDVKDIIHPGQCLRVSFPIEERGWIIVTSLYPYLIRIGYGRNVASRLYVVIWGVEFTY